MANDRLRDALLRHGMTPDDLAERLAVDRKTCERWVTQGRVPYRRHRHSIAALVRESESYLWPNALPAERRALAAKSEVVELFPHRADAPVELWTRLLDGATSEINMLAYAGLFLPEQIPKLVSRLTKRAAAGVVIRILLGEPDSAPVLERGREEGIGEAISHKIRNVLVYYQPLRRLTGVEVRLHRTNLYNSIYQFDDQMLVSLHAYGVPAGHAPLLHLRQLTEGDLFTTYAQAYARIWSGSSPAWPDDGGGKRL